jgi:hypothetical protein
MILAVTIGILLVLSLLFLVFIKVIGSRGEEVEVFEEVRNIQVMQILVPRENDKTPLAAEQMFSSIHGILEGSIKSLDLVSFEIVADGEDGIRFFVAAPQHLCKFIEGQMYAQYPNADIRHVKDYIYGKKDGQMFVTAGVVELDKSFIFPIKTFRNFDVDPLAAITGAIGDLEKGSSAWIQLVIRPVSNYWQEDSKEYITAVREGKDVGKVGILKKLGEFLGKMIENLSTSEETKGKEVVQLAPGQEEELTEIENKMLKVGSEICVRIVTKADSQIRAEQIFRDVVASFKQFTTAHLNSFVYTEQEKNGEDVYTEYVKRYLSAETADILNIEELASVYHLPNISVETPNIVWSRARKGEPPMNLPTSSSDEYVNIFAETDYRGERIEFGLKKNDRRRHFYLLGKTGAGKTTLFKNMFISDILAGEGACFIDPHGEVVEELLDYIPEHRKKDVIYFNPADVEHPIGFNMLELDDQSQRDLVADGVVEVFKKQFDYSWGPRLQYILTNTISTCLEAQGTTLLSVIRILNDRNYRKFILKQVKDPILYKFWSEEFAQMSQNNRLATEAVAPIQNKVGRFLSSSVIRNIVGQVHSTINLRDIMDNKKIFLVNLAQGKLGEETASLLGGMIITRLQATAMERIDIPQDERSDFYLYVDEFQNYATESFAKILSEARKFKLNLVMTNQYIDQLPVTVQQAIFGNVGTLGSFVVSQSDANILANEFAPMFSAEDLVSLDAYAMYVKLCIDGMTSVPFSAKSLAPRYQKMGLKDEIVEISRDEYSTDKEIIEDKVMRWSNQTYSDKGNRSVIKKEEDQAVKKPPEHEVKTEEKRKEEEKAKNEDTKEGRKSYKVKVN